MLSVKIVRRITADHAVEFHLQVTERAEDSELLLRLNPALLVHWPGGDDALASDLGRALGNMLAAATGEEHFTATRVVPDTPAH